MQDAHWQAVNKLVTAAKYCPALVRLSLAPTLWCENSTASGTQLPASGAALAEPGWARGTHPASLGDLPH